MRLTVQEIAGIIGTEQIIGSGDIMITGVSSFEEAVRNDITFAGDAKFLNRLDESEAGAVIVPEAFDAGPPPVKDSRAYIKAENPKISFFKVVSLFHPQKFRTPGVDPGALIGRNAVLGNDVIIMANTFIGDNVTIGDNVCVMPGVCIADDVSIGAGTVIKPNVTLMEKTVIGKNVIIHPNTTIGSDGFGFAQNSGRHEKIIHTGSVEIGDHSEIGAGNTIDRGTLGRTIIGKGVKTDNLVHIAHNVKIGDNTLIVAQVGIAGSTQIGSNVIIAGKAGISGHLKIEDNSIIGPFAGIYADVKKNEIISGIPGMPHKRWRKVVSIISRLPEIRKKLFSIEKRIKNLEDQQK